MGLRQTAVTSLPSSSMGSRFVSSPSAAAAPVVNTTTTAAAADITTVIAAAATTGFLTIGDPESRLAAREALKAQIRQEILAEQSDLHPLPPHKPIQTEIATGQWRCDLCEMSMTSNVQFREHLEGVKHRDLCEKIMAREAPFTEPVQFVEQQAKDEKGSGFFCDVCQIGVTGETAFQEHLKGKKHQNKAVTGLEPMSGRKRRAELGDEPAGAFNCDMCQVRVTSAQMLDVHLKGKKHRSKETIGVVSIFECEICGVQCTAQSIMDAHLAGKKHKAKVEKSQKDRQETTALATDSKK